MKGVSVRVSVRVSVGWVCVADLGCDCVFSLAGQDADALYRHRQILRSHEAVC